MTLLIFRLILIWVCPCTTSLVKCGGKQQEVSLKSFLPAVTAPVSIRVIEISALREGKPLKASSQMCIPVSCSGGCSLWPAGSGFPSPSLPTSLFLSLHLTGHTGLISCYFLFFMGNMSPCPLMSQPSSGSWHPVATGVIQTSSQTEISCHSDPGQPDKAILHF